MATANKEDILLRSESNAPLVTKGSEFTYKNLDDNFITIFNQLLSLSTSSNVDAYSAAVTYVTGDYVVSLNQLYRMIQVADSINDTPASNPLVWQEVYASDLAQEPNGIKSFKTLIPSATILSSGLVGGIPFELIAAKGVNKIIKLESLEATVKFGTGSPAGTAYATTTNLAVYNAGIDVAAGDSATATLPSVLAATVVKTQTADFTTFSQAASRNDNQANKAIMVAAAGGDPTAGDSDVLFTGTYRIIDNS